jgi:hypothetical protein
VARAGLVAGSPDGATWETKTPVGRFTARGEASVQVSANPFPVALTSRPRGADATPASRRCGPFELLRYAPGRTTPDS